MVQSSFHLDTTIVSQLLDRSRPVAVLAISHSGGLDLTWQSLIEPERIHTVLSSTVLSSTVLNSTGLSAHGNDLVDTAVAVVAVAPTRTPAEGEQLARQLSRNEAVSTVAVATSVDGDTGDSLTAAALATHHQAVEFGAGGVTVCSDDDRSWTMEPTT